MSFFEDSKPRKNRPFGFNKQCISLTASISPLGDNGSPYLPRPECSIDEKLAELSNNSILLFKIKSSK